MNVHRDHRRHFFGDIFDTEFGDVNVVYLEPHIPIGWHRHQRQDDQLFLVSGAVTVKEIWPSGTRHVQRLDYVQRGPVMIPRGNWHGYEATEPGTILVQWNGPGKYDGTDEERLSFADEPWT